MKLTTRLAASAAATALVLAGCGTSDDAAGATGGKLEVFAAASLKKSFTDIGEQFKSDNPGTQIDFTFAGSSDLVTQLTQGAPGDVFASADTINMDKAATADLLAGTPVNFASNTLTIVVAPGNPKKVASFEDLTRPGLAVVACAPQVPCGAATQKVEKATGVHLDPVSQESQVTDVLTKVTTGQADAGLVYVTDAKGAGDKVAAVAFPESADAVNVYPIATLKQSRNPTLATKFIEAVTGDTGEKVLAAAGFAKP
ncbi:molybdate ABC transporter substrate-binding protein [Mycolicibacterium sp. P1-18]|uniref:molybdate ABC transporter substrate-binding protein n=1 Tax=Mycolicibacterium sp. P1-18 TaxID=2024615 RepID=UPI0011F1E4E2|nr:molybdate ABC transporter substrate-binding protein [Mycolicibacterium sp. P1-18]KAA0094712.1 molybdate ABC transporter substrate-binding protein [Mycolicibacterium sp. P1-18]